jgi:hypothetical protein
MQIFAAILLILAGSSISGAVVTDQQEIVADQQWAVQHHHIKEASIFLQRSFLQRYSDHIYGRMIVGHMNRYSCDMIRIPASRPFTYFMIQVIEEAVPVNNKAFLQVILKGLKALVTFMEEQEEQKIVHDAEG